MESGPSRVNNPVINLSKAVEDVQNGTCITVAAAKHNIPVSILFNRVSAIRQLKKKKLNSEMQSSSNEDPDKYGLVVNERFFRFKHRKKFNCIYVNQLYYNALHFALEGNSVEDTILNFKVDRRTLERKLSEVKGYLNRQSSSSQNPSKNILNKRRKENLSTMFHVMKTLVENCGILLPEKFISAVYYTQKGVTFENVAERFSFDMTSFCKVVRMLRVFQKLAPIYIKSKSSFIQCALPSIHPSFSNVILTKDECLECLHVYFKKSGKRRTYEYESLKTALIEVENGMSIKEASKLYSVPYSTLRDKAVQMNILPSDHSSPIKKEIASQDEKIVSLFSHKSVSPIKSSKAKRSQPLCLFCHQPGYREEEIGKLHILNKVIVHYYCLLFSCALEQNGEDDEGILGFLPKDIIKEINRGKKLKCTHCGLNGATIGCSHKNCKRVYHFPCGLDSFAQYIFTDNFSSMCSKHRKYQIGQGKGQITECPICLESMEADPKYAVWPPCCKRSSWFHKKCIQKLALSAGYFFKCPLCNDKNVFSSEMLRQGIFVPDQDASWELVPNAYQELLERPIRCTANVCKCPSGRNSDEEGTRWEVLLCYYCGSTGIHIFCGNLKPSSTEWHCPTCVAMLEERSVGEKREKEIRRREAHALKRKQCDFVEENQECDENSGSSLSKRNCRNSNSRSPQKASSSNVIDLDSEDDQIISVPRGIRGHIIIKDLAQNNEPLSDALQEMKQYAENISQKLVERKIEVEAFLNLLNSTISSSSRSRKRYIIDETHYQKFEMCSLNFDQMRFLRNVFELGFALCLRRSKVNSCSRAVKRNPFCRKKRRYKDVLQVKDSLVNLLVKARSANLLEGNNTWSSYGNRQKNAYFNKVNKDIPSTSNECEIDTSRSGRCSTFHSSRYVYPIRLMESDEICEECMWCNIALQPGIHPTTFKSLEISSVTLSVICTSCLTNNVFYNVFRSFANSPPYCLKTEERSNKFSEKSIRFDNSDTKDTNIEIKKNQLKIFDYFSPLSKPKSESDEMKYLLKSRVKLVNDTSSTKYIYNEIQNSSDTKLDKEEIKLLVKKEEKNLELCKTEKYKDSSNIENINISSNSNFSLSTPSYSQSHYPRVLENVNYVNQKRAESLPSGISAEFGNFEVSSEPKLLTNISDTFTTSSEKCLKNKDSNSTDTIYVKTQMESIRSSPHSININEPKAITNMSDDSSSTDSTARSLRNKASKDSGTLLSVKIIDSLKSPLKKTDASKPTIEGNATNNMSTDNSSKGINKKHEIPIIKDPPKTTTSGLRILKPGSTGSSVETCSESKTDAILDASASLRKFRSKDQSSSSATVVNSNKTSTLGNSNPRQIVYSRSELLQNLNIKNLQSKSENNSSSVAAGTNTKSTDNLSKIKISENVQSSSSKEHIKHSIDECSKAESSKGRSQSSTMGLDNASQSCPPVHQPMDIICTNTKVCKGCTIAVKKESLRKKSKIYCPCCKNVPTFCDKEHFDYYHSQVHHWATIPPNDGILRPVRKCRICTKSEFTRFYCPACPGNLGYCSYNHYIQNHKNEKEESKRETPKSPNKSTSESARDRDSSSSGVTLKSFRGSNIQNIKDKVVPQTLTFSSFNFPAISRRIDFNNETQASSSTANESLKGIRINRTSNKDYKKSDNDKS